MTSSFLSALLLAVTAVSPPSAAGRKLAPAPVGVSASRRRPAGRARSPSYARMTPAQREALLGPIRQLTSVSARLLRVTAPFLGTRYALSPLGEGKGVDPDPLLRFDAVDCLTFVETSLALAAAPDASALLPVLDDIRYAALPPAFQNRNHFMEAEWIPNNVLKGWVRDIAPEVGGKAVRVATKVYSLAVWKKRRELGDMPLDSDAVPRGTFRLDYVPLAFVRAHPERIPSGTILFVVRQNFLSIPTRVSHVGFVFSTPHGQVLRHASESPYRRVVDEPFSAFLARNAGYKKWPVRGFALFEPRLPRARVQRIVAFAAASR